MRHRTFSWACVLGALLAAAAGCSRQETTPDCAADARYATARSAPPVQIPDDLSPPDEDDALRLPPDAAVAAAPPETGGCLESPPSFFGDSSPFRRSADAEEAEREQPEPPEAPAADGDRVIDN